MSIRVVRVSVVLLFTGRIIMCNLYDLYWAYQGKRNILGKLRVSKTRVSITKFSTSNGMTKRHDRIAYRNEVTANLTMKTKNNAIEIKAKTRHLECFIYA